jgi:hypothetical protein
MAGIRPANAPIRMAEAMPPDYASAGITTAQLFVLAYTAVAAAPANADAAADDGEQDRLGEELRPDLGVRPSHVVPERLEAPDGRLAAEGAVWSAPIVELEPAG